MKKVIGYIESKNYRIGLVLALTCAIISWAGIKDGPSIPTGDSMSYLNCSRTILATHNFGFPYYQLDSNGAINLEFSEPNTEWPPATSALLSAFQMLSFDLWTSVILLIIIFSGLSTFLAWRVTYEITNSTTAAFIITVLFMNMWAFRYWVGLSFMSEGLFLTMTMLGMLYLIKIQKLSYKPPVLLLISCGLLFSVTYYIKSNAPGYILPACLTAFLIGKKWQDRIRNGAIISFGCFLGMLPWLLRNLNYGTIGGGGKGANENTLMVSFLEWLRLFVPRHGSYFSGKITICIAAIFLITFIILLAILFSSKKSREEGTRGIINTFKNNFAFSFAVIYCFVFIGIILFAIYVIPKTSNIEMRYWLELAPFGMSLAWVVLREYRLKLTGFKHKLSTILGIVILSVSLVANIAEDFRNNNRDWNILPKDNNRKEIRAEIFKIINCGKPIRFLSNQNVRFEILTGLTSWNLVDNNQLPEFSGVYCYAAFPEQPDNTMDLEKCPPKPPKDWRFVAKLDNIVFYMP